VSPVGRLFFEIGGDTSRLNASIKEAIKTAEEAGVRITRAGQSFISKFDEALNPTKKLAEQINLLSAAGKSQADIWKVMAEEINRAAEAAKKNGQAIDPMVKSLQEMNKASLAGKISFESIGKAVGDFAAHPLESAKTGVTSFLGLLGPTAVGVGAVATGVIAAGAAVYNFAADAADAAEQIQNLSYATGMTVERVQALQRAGKEKGLGDLTGTIEKLNAQLGSEGGPFAEAILRAGITPKAGADAIYYLEELRKHYAAISDPAERAQKATGDLGRRLLDLLPIVLNDKESFADMVSEIERSNAVMKGPQMQVLMDLHEQIDKHGRAWESVKLKAKEYAGEATLAFMKAIEAITGSSEQLDNAANDWSASVGHVNEWTGSYGVFGKETPKDTIAERAKEIAKAEAIASGTTQELLGLTMQLYDLEKQFTEEKKKQSSLYEYDSKKILSLAQQIASTKELIKETNDLNALNQKQWKDAEQAQKKIQDLTRETAKIQEEIDRKGHAALVPSQSEIDAYLKKFDKEMLDRVKTYNEVEAKLTREISTNRLDELKAQREILADTVPLTEKEREQMNVEKAHIDYMIRAEEIRVKYQQIRMEIEEKLNKLSEDDPLRKSAEADIEKLGEKEREELERAGKLFSADVLKVHREEYQRMIQSVREGAGEIFDAITSRGKGAFQSLMDWLEGTFLSGLRTLFQNLIESIVTGFKGGFGQLLQGIVPSGGSSSGWSIGNIAKSAAGSYGEYGSAIPAEFEPGTLYTVGSGGTFAMDYYAALTGGSFVIPETTASKPSILGNLLGSGGKAMDWGTFFGGGDSGFFGSEGSPGFLGSGTGGINGKGVGGALGAMMMAGGATMFMDSLIRKGAGAWAEALGGGTMTGFALGGPMGAGIGALAGLGSRLARLATGKNSYEAGSMEVSRDFGGISVSQDEFKNFLNSYNISESQAYPIRKNLLSSPDFLKDVAWQAAQAQGKTDAFLKSLEKVQTSWGVFNFRPAFDVGRLTGDWSELNKIWKESKLGDIKNLSEDVKESLLIDDKTLEPWEQLVVDLNDVKKTIQESIPTVKTMYETFLETGEITEDLRKQVAGLGGDMERFERVSDLTHLNNNFNEMVKHFRETGEILPELRQMFADFGGDLSKLDDAAALPGLHSSLNFLNSLASGLESLAPELDPIKALLSGQWNANIISALSAAGLDPSKFESLSGLIGMEQNWSKIATPFTRLSPELEKALKTYGGEEGKLAVERYAQGFNTITEGLLNATKQAMDEAYQAAVKDALDYIGEAQEETSDKITTLTTAVEEQFTIVSKNITDAITDAKQSLVDELEKLINAAVRSGNNPASSLGSGTAPEIGTDAWQQYQQAHDAWSQAFNQILATAGPDVAQQWALMNPEPQPPQAHTGGLVIEAQSGEAVLDREQTRNLLRGNQAPVINLINPIIYGFQDFVEQVRRAGLDLQRRGDPQWA
jgi:hypothetical protein